MLIGHRTKFAKLSNDDDGNLWSCLPSARFNQGQSSTDKVRASAFLRTEILPVRKKKSSLRKKYSVRNGSVRQKVRFLKVDARTVYTMP
jgi:hypothetical protein